MKIFWKRELLACFAFFVVCVTVLPSAMRADTNAVFVCFNYATTSSSTKVTTISIAPPGTGWAYGACAQFTGSNWNQFPIGPIGVPSGSSNGVVGSTTILSTASNTALVNPVGVTNGIRLTASVYVGVLDTTSTNRTEPRSGTMTGAQGPAGLMNSCWRLFKNGNVLNYKLTGLSNNAPYLLYIYASIPATNNGGLFILGSSNVPANAPSYIDIPGGSTNAIFSYNGTNYAPLSPAIPGTTNVTAANNSPAWGVIEAISDATGTLLLSQTQAPSAAGCYINGFQLVPYPAPTISSQPPASLTAASGSNAVISVTGSENYSTNNLTYQWLRAGTIIADGPTGSGATYSGATSNVLTISNVQSADATNYSVVVSNPGGSVTSSLSTLAVIPSIIPPSINAQPVGQSVGESSPIVLTVTANGSSPLSYQWQMSTDGINYTNIGSNSATFSIASASITNSGFYQIVITNGGGAVTSTPVTVLVSAVAPAFVTSPSSGGSVAGGTTGFTATVSGTAPIAFQWYKDGTLIDGATNTSLVVTNVQSSSTGGYSLQASNSAGVISSANAALVILPPTLLLPNSEFNLTGFGGKASGGGVIATNDPAYVQVSDATGLASALYKAYKTNGAVKVIEIMNDLDLGYNEIGTNAQSYTSIVTPASQAPLLHPKLLVTGVSVFNVVPRGGLTIFSANGSTIRHGTINIKGATNVIVRNLRFDELWEWDESTKGNYDRNDWDFIDLGNGSTATNVWVDHCTFTKSYDGILDTKAGSGGITISWCKYTGDDGATNSNSFVWQQINALESNAAAYPFYYFLRSNGFSPNDIVTISQGHDKTHLAGANSLDSNNATLTMTFHHDWFINNWDRCVPRLRAGNVHNYNNFADISGAYAAKQLRDLRASTMSATNQYKLNNTYNFSPPLNGSISTENGAILVEKCVYRDSLTPLRNNQTDPNNPIYTGKIMALDTICQLDAAPIFSISQTYYRGDSTNSSGAQILGPVQAPVIPFSWNLPGGILPYSYPADDPSQLQGIVAVGAGAGAVTWAKTNWLVTNYTPTAPVITTPPQNVVVASGYAAAFTAGVCGSTNLSYQWQKSTNGVNFTNISGGTNPILTISSVSSLDVGSYQLVVSNAIGSVTSTPATLFTAQTNIASILFGNTNVPYNGGPRPVSVSTDPLNLTVTVRYKGSTNAPSAIGSYPLLAIVNDTNYQGSNTGTLTIYDATSLWRQAYFGTTSNTGNAADAADPYGNGLKNLQAYTFGVDPSIPSRTPLLNISNAGSQNVTLSFLARAAGSGAGYAGLTRYYNLEATTNLTNSSWVPLAGYSNIQASNQLVTITNNTSVASKLFYRLKAWLQ